MGPDARIMVVRDDHVYRRDSIDNQVPLCTLTIIRLKYYNMESVSMAAIEPEKWDVVCRITGWDRCCKADSAATAQATVERDCGRMWISGRAGRLSGFWRDRRTERLSKKPTDDASCGPAGPGHIETICPRNRHPRRFGCDWRHSNAPVAAVS